MVAYSFKERFVAPIQDGVKRQTIRSPRLGRSRHARPGDNLQLYTAMRTKYCTLIGRAVCLSVSTIALDFEHTKIQYRDVGGGVTTIFDRDKFAEEDGFRDWNEMRSFWGDQHPGVSHFDGILIRWTYFEPRKKTVA